MSFHLSIQAISLFCGHFVFLDIAICSDFLTLFASFLTGSLSILVSDSTVDLFPVASIILSCSRARQELVRLDTRCPNQGEGVCTSGKETCTAKISRFWNDTRKEELCKARENVEVTVQDSQKMLKRSVQIERTGTVSDQRQATITVGCRVGQV